MKNYTITEEPVTPVKQAEDVSSPLYAVVKFSPLMACMTRGCFEVLARGHTLADIRIAALSGLEPHIPCPKGMIEVIVEHWYNGGNGNTYYCFHVTPEIAAEFSLSRDDTDKVLELVSKYDHFQVSESRNGGNDYEGHLVEVKVDGDFAALARFAELTEDKDDDHE